ncbi:hypothetical protein A5N15_02835 [Rothia kristinae]|uniref:Uncharacterized protein n=1 Tax=Rothia kristinae TaxID=37923 RepID=A0A657IWR6_9MICC|nr:hypothetical protein A5N15_02835 [Rothia kristinae]
MDGGHVSSGQLLVHTSGRSGTEVFDTARARGAVGLAIHPAMTFTGLSLDLDRLRSCPFGVTAPAAFLPVAQAPGRGDGRGARGWCRRGTGRCTTRPCPTGPTTW